MRNNKRTNDVHVHFLVLWVHKVVKAGPSVVVLVGVLGDDSVASSQRAARQLQAVLLPGCVTAGSSIDLQLGQVLARKVQERALCWRRMVKRDCALATVDGAASEVQVQLVGDLANDIGASNGCRQWGAAGDSQGGGRRGAL